MTRRRLASAYRARLHREGPRPVPARDSCPTGPCAQRDPAPNGSDAQEGVIGMSAAATSIGVTAPLVSYPEPGTGRQDWPGFASGYCAEREAKHLAAVARTLQWADEAAERGDNFDAIAWLETLEAIGDQLPEVYESRRRAWSARLRRARVTEETARARPDVKRRGQRAGAPQRGPPLGAPRALLERPDGTVRRSRRRLQPRMARDRPMSPFGAGGASDGATSLSEPNVRCANAAGSCARRGATRPLCIARRFMRGDRGWARGLLRGDRGTWP